MGKKSEMDQLSLGLQTEAAGERLFEEIHALPRLEMAYAKVRSNGGSPGPDGQSIEDFGENLSDNLAELAAELKSKSYRPQPVRRVSIPKSSGGERHLGIPNVRDRIVHYSIALALEPWFEPYFSEKSNRFLGD